MARRPFFSGNYGSSLGSTAQAADIIARAGQQRGQALAGMGAQIGGMIQQYGLNKEKQKKADARIKSALNGMGEFVEAGALSPENKTMAEEFLNDPNRSSIEKVAFIEEQEKRMFQLPKLQLAQAQAKDASNQALIGELTKDNDIAMSGLKVSSQTLMNRHLELDNLIATAKTENERDRYRQEKEINDANIAQIREQTRGIQGKNDIFDLTKEDMILQNQLKTATYVQALAKGATEIEVLQQKMETEGQLDPLEQQRLLTLQSEQEKNLAEADNLRKQSEQIQGVLDASNIPTESSDEPAIKLDSLDISAQADIAGQFKGAMNAIVGYVSGGTPFEADAEGKAQVEVINQQLRPAFVKALSDKGSVYTQQEINKILPQTSDNDGTFRAKITKLPALLRRQVTSDRKTLRAGIGTESQKKQAFDNIQKLPALADALDQIIAREKAEQTTGTTSTNIKFKILD
tara:strand:+ start:242 stop:1624 length:1383 start_codon:yes stop_codon:yes gene_type:complete